MIIIVGFTQSDMAHGYSSFDGYREGAEQKVMKIDLPDYESEAKIESIAERVFEATNHPDPDSLTGLAGQIVAVVNQFLEIGAYVRSLSVGDTVELPERGERVACDSFGWKQLEVAK